MQGDCPFGRTCIGGCAIYDSDRGQCALLTIATSLVNIAQALEDGLTIKEVDG